MSLGAEAGTARSPHWRARQCGIACGQLSVRRVDSRSLQRDASCMRGLLNMSMAQRVVAVIGLGAAMVVAWSWWHLGEFSQPADWFAYVPDSSTMDTYYVVAQRRWEHLAVPLGLVVLWTVASIWLLAPRSTTEDGGSV